MTALTRGLETAFRAAKIPYQVVGGVSFYERQEIKDVLAYLNLMANPKDDVAFAPGGQRPPAGPGQDVARAPGRARAGALGLPLLAMARQAPAVPGLKDKAAAALRDFAMLMDELAALRDHAAEEVIRRLLTLTGYREYLEAEPKRRRARTGWRTSTSSISAAREFDREHPGAAILDFLEEISLASPSTAGTRRPGAVTLMTLHAAKGLEFPVVFIVGLEQGLLPHARANETDERAGGGAAAPLRRHHPGPARAVPEPLPGPEFRGQRQATIPSRFLAELPEEPMESATARAIELPERSPRPAASP